MGEDRTRRRPPAHVRRRPAGPPAGGRVTVAIDVRRLPGTLFDRGTATVDVDVVHEVEVRPAPVPEPPLSPVERRRRLVRLRSWAGVHRRSLLVLLVLLTFVGVVQAWA